LHYTCEFPRTRDSLQRAVVVADACAVKSFKGKLVAHFLLLSLVPLLAANLGFWNAERDDAAREADRELRTALRAATVVYADALQAAHARAKVMARRDAFVAAIATGDRSRLARFAQNGNVRVTSRSGRVGRAPTHAATSTVTVVHGGRRLGSVTAFVELDERIVRTLRERSGLPPTGLVAVADDRRVVAGPGRGTQLPPRAGAAFSMHVGSTEYRALAARVGPPDGSAIVALVPAGPIEAASAAAATRLGFALAASLLVIALIAYFEARAIVKTLGRLAQGARAIAAGELGSRVPVHGRDEVAAFSNAFNDMAAQLERRVEDLQEAQRRLQTSTARFADALASTHDEHQLARVVVAAAMDATGATGGAFSVADRTVVKEGRLEGVLLELPVRARGDSFGLLALAGIATATKSALEFAESLVKHAAVAFENARLHAELERQAHVDELTGLTTRRHGRELLEHELQRAARACSALSVAICDLDGFKLVNDRHGHAAGDAVLRAFAELVRQRIRQIDVACRWGGEEFLFVLPETDLDGAQDLVESLRAQLASLLIALPNGSAIHVTASFGISAFEAGISAEELVARADRALYEAKRSGKNAVASLHASTDSGRLHY
jgi:diguanylate cyclase (GGDEF)-like protein